MGVLRVRRVPSPQTQLAYLGGEMVTAAYIPEGNDPIQLCQDIPLASLKVCLDIVRKKHPLDDEALAAVLTVVGYGVSKFVLPRLSKDEADRPLVWDAEGFDLEVSLESAVGSVEFDAKAGIIPWERIVKALLDALLDRLGV